MGQVAPSSRCCYLFYNNSSFDGNNPGADANDDNAIAVDKFPFIPGQTSTFGSISSYDKGINGVILYVQHLPDNGADVGADNLDILVATTDNLNTWVGGPAPQVTVTSGVGPGGADQVTLIFPDDSVEDTYIAIRILAGPETGLAQTETYLFGSVVGETGQTAVPPPSRSSVAVPETLPRSPRTSPRWRSSAPRRSPIRTTSIATARWPSRTSC